MIPAAVEALDIQPRTGAASPSRSGSGLCRACGEPLRLTFVDLGATPLANSYLSQEELGEREEHYPLHAWVCVRCLLVQIEQFATPERIFRDYAYFSSWSDSWLAHAQRFAHAACQRFGLGRSSRVIEVGSNDGYLLQYFRALGVEVLGIEPAANVAGAALAKGIPTTVEFFSGSLADALAREGKRADMVVANNVLAHVPELRDFVRGLATVLKPNGVVTIEVPHLVRLVEEGQFDTIYHEHFSYFSFLTATRVLEAGGLRVFDVEELPTHGGSLRIYARREEDAGIPVGDRVPALLGREVALGFDRVEKYLRFEDRVRRIKRDLLRFLIEEKEKGNTIVGYGAAAKGNTLLNYCGIRTDFLEYVVDRNPAKQGRWLPGSRIPIRGPECLALTRPDLLLVLAWNLREEIVSAEAGIRRWGGRFVVPVPEPRIVD